MIHIPKKSFSAFEKVKRLNLINSITGIKPANLIGTISPEGHTNLAIFSSVVHLGSHPALLGMVVRPAQDVERHTFDNLRSSGFYTINHVQSQLVQQAHYTSAKFKKDESEFGACGFTEQYLDDFPAPYVAESQLKIGMQFGEVLSIEANGTQLVIGTVEHIYLSHNIMNDAGQLDLEGSDGVGISGLNTYYRLQKIGTLPYARPGELPQFEGAETKKPAV